jgi:hypothetical protein
LPEVADSKDTAERIALCLFEADGTETAVVLPEVNGFIRHGFLPTVQARSTVTVDGYALMVLQAVSTDALELHRPVCARCWARRHA